VAKLIAHGPSRDEAIARMQQALAAFTLEGLTTNIAVHRQLMTDANFHAGDFDTTLLTQVLTQQD
jgi:acetyl-CoA carboxylase, biotin carboxylase subunit